MTEQEQIEKWRKEFEKFIVKAFEVSNPTAEKRRDSGEYFYAHVQLAWLAWREAKRAQKPVELPKPEMCFTSSKSGHGSFAYVHLDALIESLKSAGTKYTVKGE
jgi:hypothetical protein